jgi:hypothetical protein
VYPLADIAIRETENGVGIHVMAITLDLGNFGFGGLHKGLALSATFDAFEPCPHCRQGAIKSYLEGKLKVDVHEGLCV